MGKDMIKISQNYLNHQFPVQYVQNAAICSGKVKHITLPREFQEKYKLGTLKRNSCRLR